MIFVMDVDGTICFNGMYIEEPLRKEIKNIATKHQVIFASARPIRDLLPVIRGFEDYTLIGGNGSIISQDNQISVVKSISEDPFNHIKSLIHKYNLQYIVDDSFDYAANVSPDNTIFRQLDPSHLANRLTIEEIEKPIKVILVNLDDHLFELVQQELEKYESSLSIHYHHRENNIDITAQNINKYTTLRKVIGNLPYFTYGNDVNDYELLKHAEKAYFVGERNESMRLTNAEYLESHAQAVMTSLKNY
ncbi:HAD-IIB family hydrolase [Staphylococcus pettenkoferi]|uniref:Cof-type HAD-IIB family hydrolase n=1 Tax=Staphylococcus pettenkoferi TaxID=170573 RepID=A0ABT4BJT9_9STAP|nr:HAD-IIB family hydrolase [Staphylococcus pettenkoferi]MCY1565587.1 Cof-type HAD-IIB family hydrolase [Staphylococcus pettenkoferi]MCY1570946.1 Cof-type HAD-IIB family hydrolase [Staphylococcus pettenkoferi]MCY1582941.1 Cof-type HAD-IIB family hydrolase [Staphylococcus pettenkoferi]MCY1607102.1 Cof-type HAD-IIB family hydrolase [Staphylococcus pettenkoferi]MDH9616241.1 HAD-IIB family hydrolase [Staphylococcus pettenkoferi]